MSFNKIKNRIYKKPLMELRVVRIETNQWHVA